MLSSKIICWRFRWMLFLLAYAKPFLLHLLFDSLKGSEWELNPSPHPTWIGIHFQFKTNFFFFLFSFFSVLNVITLNWGSDGFSNWLRVWKSALFTVLTFVYSTDKISVLIKSLIDDDELQIKSVGESTIQNSSRKIKKNIIKITLTVDWLLNSRLAWKQAFLELCSRRFACWAFFNPIFKHFQC